ncbi:imm11 family protein [Paenibacillus radicis (ex Xue et al. 2023)]|uniref:Immunity MXAN-0049 protein domain-containing protein n=1 Tax=Paenibacillus radicis (ex Xue et al. 2023) TaxID=2972489 RepID=A0ABT1YSK6_9BACL|nr:DUF1629 domain-containing protein [Paenibacillus radicis (ex Xue et al. 2023)]MCR8635339.1 hypothetical protein [Paenibacillus radicis (ex Xue et al. 2023)]
MTQLKIWLLDYHPSFNNLEFADDEDYSKVNAMLSKKQPLSKEWSAVNVNIVDKGKPSDILGRFNGALAISKATKQILVQHITDNIEFLPLKTEFSGEEYYILHVLNILDCIDPINSKVKRYIRDDIAVYDEYSLSLVEERLMNQHMFKVKLPNRETFLPYVYVSDQLMEILSRSIQGCQLLEIWNSEFSWKQAEEKYDWMCQQVDLSLSRTFDFNTAQDYVTKYFGETVYSGKWALQTDERGEIVLGTLKIDGEYDWMNPIYYPPIILDLTWGVKR